MRLNKKQESVLELILMRDALRERLIDIVLSSGIGLIMVIAPFLANIKNDAIGKIKRLVFAIVIYIATKPLRKLTETIKELDYQIEGLILGGLKC